MRTLHFVKSLHQCRIPVPFLTKVLPKEVKGDILAFKREERSCHPKPYYSLNPRCSKEKGITCHPAFRCMCNDETLNRIAVLRTNSSLTSGTSNFRFAGVGWKIMSSY